MTSATKSDNQLICEAYMDSPTEASKSHHVFQADICRQVDGKMKVWFIQDGTTFNTEVFDTFEEAAIRIKEWLSQ